MTTLLELRGLGIRTPERTLVQGVDVDVLGGKVTALVGPSGAGKSLTARACMCVLDVHPGLFAGSLRYPPLDAERDWFGNVVDAGMPGQQSLLRETRSLRGGYITYSPQAASSALNPGRTLGRQLELAILRRDMAPDSVPREIGKILAEVGLDMGAAAALPGELSGGMCQRAALAIAIAPQPQVVIADEPETGLDPVLRRAIIELLVQVCRDHGAGLLLISHHEDTVKRIADTVVRIGGGPDA